MIVSGTSCIPQSDNHSRTLCIINFFIREQIFLFKFFVKISAFYHFFVFKTIFFLKISFYGLFHPCIAYLIHCWSLQFVSDSFWALPRRTYVLGPVQTGGVGWRPGTLSVLQGSRLSEGPHLRWLRQVGGVVVQVPGLAGQRTPLRALGEHAGQRQTEGQEAHTGHATSELTQWIPVDDDAIVERAVFCDTSRNLFIINIWLYTKRFLPEFESR